MQLDARRGLVQVPARRKLPAATTAKPVAAGQPSAELKREPEPSPEPSLSLSPQPPQKKDTTHQRCKEKHMQQQQQQHQLEAYALAFGEEQRRRTEQEQRDEQLLGALAVARVLARRKQPTETFHEFAEALRQEGETHAIPEPYYVAAFINGMGYEDTAKLLLLTKPADLDAAATAAIYLQRSDGSSPAPQPAIALQTSTRRKRQRSNTWSGSAASGFANSGGTSRKRARPGVCYACCEEGHYARDCPTRWKP